ncbi:S9 family peptidase [Sphingomonas donggukensis]|uniref:S9 family peptidase n=1 Tax=Sphingomonas donggukensis TaxID=2949093 RepID=A0ABY4TRP6_9SPHN|nr:S9 family peptidase [Sphingomonas donggukensis]URW74500.1 S9 family peptidase [Sphingomonas donggukensis]
MATLGSSTTTAQTNFVPRPIEQFAELPTLMGPKISPNGKLIAAQVASRGKQYLAIIPIEGGPPRFVATGDNDLNWWRWVNDDWMVVGIGNKVPMPGIGDWYLRRAIGVSAAGDKVVPLMAREAAQAADDVIWVADDGTPRILLSLQKSIYVDNLAFWPEVVEVDVSTGKSRRAMGSREGVMSWSADGKGVVRMGIGHSRDGRSTRVLYRPAADTPFKEIVRETRGREDIVVPSLFMADPSKALAFAEDDAGMQGIYEYDLTNLKLGKRLYGSSGHDVDGLIPTTTRDGLAGVSYLDDKARTDWIDSDLAAMQAEITKAVSGGSASIATYSRDHKRAIVQVGASNSPGGFYLYDRSTGRMNLLGYANAQIRSARLNPVKTVRYKARDGLEIPAILTLPRGRPATGLPLIVMPHGGPFARDSEDWDWWSQSLAERGYAVVQPNYRGSSGYGSAFAKKGQGQWGLAMQDDLIDAVSYLAKQGVADPKRVCIAGASYGGYAAMRASQRDAATYRCAISYAGVSDLDRLRRYDGQFLSSGARMDWLRLQATDFRSVSPITTPEKTALPLLIVHGRKDTVVPIDQSREFVERLRKINKPVTYIEQPEADHHFSRAEDRLEFLKAMQAFLDKNNPV